MKRLALFLMYPFLFLGVFFGWAFIMFLTGYMMAKTQMDQLIEEETE